MSTLAAVAAALTNHQAAVTLLPEFPGDANLFASLGCFDRELANESPFPLGINLVVLRRAEKEVVRANARWVVAVVTYEQAGRYRASRERPGEPVREPFMPFPAKGAVAPDPRALPLPAAGSGWLGPRPKRMLWPLVHWTNVT